jgi:hypothetical protein
MAASDPGNPPIQPIGVTTHAARPALHRGRHWGDDDPALGQLILAINVSQGLRGGDIQAQRLLTEDLHHRWQQKKLGPDHSDTLYVAASLIFSLGALGEHDDAGLLGQDTLQLRRLVLGPDHVETLAQLCRGDVMNWCSAQEEQPRITCQDLLQWFQPPATTGNAKATAHGY